MWSSLNKYNDVALLFLRVGVGGLMIWLQGWPNLYRGIGRWKALGVHMKHLGITFLPVGWGFMAAFAESIGCVLLILGLFFRPAALLLLLTMVVAGVMEVKVNGWGGAHHALNLAILFFALMFIGPGKYSIDKG
jgi:putative oxidoreductase